MTLNEVIYMQILNIYSGRPTTHLTCKVGQLYRHFNLDGFFFFCKLLFVRKVGHDLDEEKRDDIWDE